MLVNNAGATWGEPIEDFPESAWDKVMANNVKSPFFLSQSLLPLLENAASADDPAHYRKYHRTWAFSQPSGGVHNGYHG